MKQLLPITFLLLTSVALAAPGDGLRGAFDASHEDDPALPNRVWRSYSVVDPSAWYPHLGVVSTRLAVSDDGGATFQDLFTLNAGQDLPNAGLSWANEVSSLLFDPSESNPGARWKLVWEKHLINANQAGDPRDFRFSWIALKAAAVPNQIWSSEIKLMAGTLYDPRNPLSPGVPAFYPLPAGISDCLVMTEPATLATPDGFYMTFHCAQGFNLAQTRFPLVRFRHLPGAPIVLDPPKGTLLGANEAAGFARKYSVVSPELARVVAFSAPELFEKDGKVYLIATPIDSQAHYLGCAVFEILDLETAQVKRTPDGVVELRQFITGQPGTFRGACAYSKGSVGSGAVLSQILPGSAKPFSLVPTQIQLP